MGTMGKMQKSMYWSFLDVFLLIFFYIFFIRILPDEVKNC
jgi:hypothetical protein